MFAKVEAGWLPGSLLTFGIVQKIIRYLERHPETLPESRERTPVPLRATQRSNLARGGK